MSTGYAIYRSVRLFCVTIFLIGLMQIMPTLSRLWIARELMKSEQAELNRRLLGPQVEVPTFKSGNRIPDTGQEKL